VDLSEAEYPEALWSEALDAGERFVPGDAPSQDGELSPVSMEVPAAVEELIAAPVSNGHQKNWLVEFHTDSVRGMYNPLMQFSYSGET
jgi:hypothetical protein